MRRRDVIGGALATGLAASAVGAGARADEAHVKCVIVGDGAVGKTCSLISYTTNVFPRGSAPAGFDNYVARVLRGDTVVHLGLWDTGGAEDYDRIRPLSYPGTDVFILAYSVISPSSFDNVAAKWVPELRLHAPAAPILLAGYKTDLRDAASIRAGRVIAPETGQALADELGLAAFRECSALTQVGLAEVFDAAGALGRGLDPDASGVLQHGIVRAPRRRWRPGDPPRRRPGG